MGIQRSGGVIVDTSISIGAVPMQSLMLGVAIGCAAAGWTVTTLGKFSRIYGNTNASNGQTTTIGGRVYTYKTVLASADDILIGSTAIDTLINFKAALNGEPGEGTLYGTGTVVSATVVAAAACIAYQNGSASFTGGGNLLIYTKTGGAVALADASNFNLLTSSLDSVLYKMVSAQTPSYQRNNIYIGSAPDAPDGWLNMFVMNRDLSDGIGVLVNWPSLANGQTYWFRACQYWFATQISGVYNQRGQALYVQVPFLQPSLGAYQVTSVTLAGGGTTATITTTEDLSAAGWTTGDSVLIKYCNNASGTGVDGTRVITMLSASSFSISGLTASGAFTTGLGLVANQTPPRRQQLECTIADCLNESADSWPVASSMLFGANTGGSSQAAFHGVIDGTPFSNNTNYCAAVPVAGSRNAADSLIKYAWGSGDDTNLEPGMCFLALYGASGTIAARMGQMYNAYLLQAANIPGGATAVVDGKHYVGIYNNDAYCQLMIATD